LKDLFDRTKLIVRKKWKMMAKTIFHYHLDFHRALRK